MSRTIRFKLSTQEEDRALRLINFLNDRMGHSTDLQDFGKEAFMITVDRTIKAIQEAFEKQKQEAQSGEAQQIGVPESGADVSVCESPSVQGGTQEEQ